MKHLRILGCVAFALLAACASTSEPPPDMLPPAVSRQAELTELYEHLSLRDEAAALQAARECAAASDRDRRFLSSLWGTRTRSAVGARRLGNALGQAGKPEESATWLDRAYGELAPTDPDLHWVRYEIACQYVAMGRSEDAIRLLANRLGTTPVPAALQQKIDELIDTAAK